MFLRPGDSLKDYRLLEVLGHGGWATVWLAERRWAGGVVDRVALKVLHPTHQMDDAARSRFLGEARLGAALRHHHIVQVQDFFEHPLPGDQRLLCLAMEYVQGPTLADVLQFAAETGAPLPPSAALQIMLQITKALGYAHSLEVGGRAQRLIHRDLKPSNCLLNWEGLLKVGDFGIARFADAPSVTQTGIINGTLQYMSPEQSQGIPTLDHRSDIYSAGLIFYECLTRRPVFRLSRPPSIPEMLALTQGQVAPALEVLAQRPDSGRWLPFFQRALALQPEDRFASAGEMGRSLRRGAPPAELEREEELRSWLHTLRLKGLGAGLPAAQSSSEHIDGEDPFDDKTDSSTPIRRDPQPPISMGSAETPGPRRGGSPGLPETLPPTPSPARRTEADTPQPLRVPEPPPTPPAPPSAQPLPRRRGRWAVATLALVLGLLMGWLAWKSCDPVVTPTPPPEADVLPSASDKGERKPPPLPGLEDLSPGTQNAGAGPGPAEDPSSTGGAPPPSNPAPDPVPEPKPKPTKKREPVRPPAPKPIPKPTQTPTPAPTKSPKPTPQKRMVSVRIDIEDQIVHRDNPLIATRVDGPPGRYTFQDDQIRDLPEGTYRLYLECNAGQGPIDQTLTLVFGSAEHLLANCKSTPPTVR